MPLEVRAPIRGSQRPGVRLPQTALADPLLLERLRRGKPVVPVEHRRPDPFRGRLRHFLLALSVGLTLAALAPRALAYFRLYEAATDFANYGLCMAGPTGPTALRDHPADFWRLVRRRLLAAAPESRPFAACARLLGGFAEGATRRRFHEAAALEFREYAGGAAQLSRRSLDELRVTAADLERLARESWPFAPPDRDEMVRPSRNARAATHPTELPTPARGRGLPDVSLGHGTSIASRDGFMLVAGRDANLVAYGSRDGGVSWVPLPRHGEAVEAFAGRCSSGGAETSFRFDSAAGQLRVESWRASEREATAPLAPLESRLLAVSCDASAVLALVEQGRHQPPALRLCPHAEPCRDLSLPAGIRELGAARARWSVARAGGVSVVSLETGGIVRVISSRDDGETWTPPIVAFDREEARQFRQSSAVPHRLLALERRVLLYAGAESASTTYPVLASDDYGASWRALAPAHP